MDEDNNAIITNLAWHHRADSLPEPGYRLLVFSPDYDDKDPFKVRIMESQFYELSKDSEWWAYLTTPDQL